MLTRFAISVALALAVTRAVEAAEPATHATLTRGDVTISYFDRGSGPAIVLVPSLGRGAEDFEDLSGRLADAGFRVLALEPRGIGGSTGPLAHQSLHDFAADFAAVIRETGVAPAVILGHAYGNTVARTVAADHPTLIRGVVLVAASGRAPFSPEIRDAINKSSDLTIPDRERIGYLAKGYFAPGHDASVWLTGWHPAAQAAQWEATRTSKLDEYIAAGGRVPILDVQGDHDVIIPARYSRDLRNELGDRVTVIVLPNAGHALLPEQPELLAAAVANWMRGLAR